MDALKLVALDHDDMQIVSVHLQDAEIQPADILWRPSERRVVLGLDRFDWEAAVGQQPEYRRRRAALRFDRVLSCRCRNIDAQDRHQMLNLLAVAFEPTEAPGGIVTLLFENGGALRLEVECIEAELADLGPAWSCDRKPAQRDEAPKPQA